MNRPTFIGRTAAQALLEPPAHKEIIELEALQAWSYADAARILSKLLGLVVAERSLLETAAMPPRLLPIIAAWGLLVTLGCVRVSEQPYVVEDSKAASVVLPPSVLRKGPDPARVTIIEFGDFQCPYCGQAQPTIKKVLETYPHEVALAFVNDPLSFHEHALACAKAFLAAGRQGKAWAMHDQMFEHPLALTDGDLDSYAAAIGLDLAQFDADRASQEIAAEVNEQAKLSASLQVDATPTFLIGGYRIVGAQPFSAFTEAIDKVLASSPPDAGL